MMENQSSRLDRLFARTELQRADREKFEAGAGWRYGLIFGIGLVLIGWGCDAWDLHNAFVEWAGLKLVLEAITIIPLTVLAGGIAGRARGSLPIKFLPWIVLGGMTGVVGLYVAFEGVSTVAALIDPSLQGVKIFPFATGAQERLPVIFLFGVIIAVPVAVLQHFATGWAWERTGRDNQITPGGCLMLAYCLPLAIVLGALFDGAVNVQFRGPFQLSYHIVQLALRTPPDADLTQMQTLERLDYVLTSKWRKNFTLQFIQHVADYDATALTSVFVDVQFDNGFIWRCTSVHNGDNLVDCLDVSVTYRDWINQFLRSGAIKCDDCQVAISPAAAAWRAQNLGDYGEPQQMTVIHRPGRVVVVSAPLNSGGQMECRFVGAQPVVIQDCVKK